ncbi:hypothetical protein FPSE_10089 [Fusarium pseudograminearum CS3096]|uniref:Uncharacterized protein n=1 Tax=Fusarium pseudograminearum (strain CS3096) TaxID=1028729 RepID=K3VBT9_FUSPC|nr:hypothetical protein FPSE_10089 [Fusarium pseudograminearum CS3096]EKJ69773.1 hypothetical protein FPSE_10089 [Fusarium pseudograminearum CS3096]
MPFDFKKYDQKCQGLTLEELQREWEHYTRLISGAATSTAVSGCAIPLTLGVSTIGVAMAAPAIHNARKKREIIERHLNRLNATHHTRKRDVLGSMAVSGTIGVVTLGVGSMGADAVATAGAEHGIQSIIANETAIKLVSHAALDGAGMAVEHAHTNHLKKKDAKKAFQKAGVFQAVQDAKAAEAGYSIQPYQNNGQYPVYAAAGPSQALPLPPPPYTAAVVQAPPQPTYTLDPNAYPQDFKSPMLSQPAPQQNGYLAPNMTGQQSFQQPYDYTQQQHVPISTAPSPMPSVSTQMFSPPQTPATHYPLPQHVPYQQGGNSPYIPGTPQTFDMSTMQQALPVTPAPPATYAPQLQQYHPSSPPQDNSRNYQAQPTQQYYPSQIAQATQAGYPPPPAATPSGYPPAIMTPHCPTPQPVPASQLPQPTPPTSVIQSPVQQIVQHHTGYQPAIPAYQPQTQAQPGYPSPQQSNMYQQHQAHPSVDLNRRESVQSIPAYQPQNQGQSGYPAPQQSNTYHQHQGHPSVDLNRRESVQSIQAPSTPHQYNPQHYGPISPQEKTNSGPVQSFGNAYVPAPQPNPAPMAYQMPPTPLPTGSTMAQYQYDNKGSYFPAQPQTPQGTGYPVTPAQV